MEQPRFPRRSASHGTLHNSSSFHGGPCIGRSPLHPLHKPLRSVNENSVLLHSPGALESMLKTTTETGDIGIFTIKPVPPSPMRDARLEIVCPHPKPLRLVDNMYRQNLAIRPPSRQDTTSEIFSIHGSESLKSGTSNLSPNSTENQGKRSYSMTTCGSRHLSHYKSTNTLQSQTSSSGSNLQRPRSPFPYPTRLKRPGVRPASPAVTENGQIDYSRMVEIDRVSYRTLHSHFDQAYSPMVRRPPLGLRADVNRSNPSLAPPGPPPNFHGPPRPPSSGRTHSPASMASWNPPFRERFDNTSVRTSSLTSATNVQPRMQPAERPGQSCAVEAPPRYYDYTEDFENKPPQLIPSSESFMPPPLRTIRYHRSMVLRGDNSHLTTGHLAAVFGEDDSAFDCESQALDEKEALQVSTEVPDHSESSTETSSRLSPFQGPNSAQSRNSTTELETSGKGCKNTRSSDIDLLPSQIGRDSIDTFSPSLDFDLRDISPTYNYATYHSSTNSKTMTNSPERLVQVSGGQAPTIRSEQGVILRDDTHYEVTGRETPDSYRSHVDNGSNEPHSPNESRGTPTTNDVEKGEIHETFTAMVRDETHHDSQAPDTSGGLVSTTVLDSPQSEDPRSLSMGEATAISTATAKKDTGQGLQISKPRTSHNQHFRCHRRNHAVLRISTTNLPRDDNEGHPHIPPTCSTVPLMSPKPISPARQLKVKNSIPQLMKALPPLPDTLGYDLPSITTDVPEDDDFADILVPFGFQESGNHSHMDPSRPSNSPQIMSGRMIPKSERDGPKFRLKIKTSSCPEMSDAAGHKRQRHTDKKMSRSEPLPGTELSDGLSENFMQSRNPNKMKVRGPRRSTLSAPHSSHSSTVRHYPDVEKPRVVTELVRQKPHDLFNAPPESEVVLLRNRRKPLPRLICPQTTVASITSDSVPSEEIVSASNQTPSASSSNTEMPSIDRDAFISSMPPHGLIKRLSNLRALLTSSTTSGSRARATNSLRMHRITSNALSSSEFNFKNSVKTSDSMSTESTQLRFGQRIRARLFRWVRGARTGMRKRANRKHSQLKKRRLSRHSIGHT